MPRFKKVYIEITNICNLSCNFCPKTGRELGFMNEEKFKRIIKEVKSFTNHIYFHLMGEPLLNKNIERFLEISNENDLKVNITTNATLINKSKDILINSPALRQMNISLHSFEANNSNISFNDYLNNIINFVDEATKKSNIICALRLWNIDTEELKANNSLNTEIIKTLEEKLKIEFDLRNALLEKNRMKLKDNVYLNMAEKFKWPDINIETVEENVFCYGLRDQIGILVDGTVVPCCLDSEGNIPLGNVYKEHLDEILESKKAKDIYDGFSRRCAVEELCKRCGYAKRYKK
ncbi:radical SAM/SPASM domain-containing protein [Clostridium sp.]|uniref:radical SAM/SPASM domain-containing protein n=1 Tax=Clostridium sp. TaxID=1506 RepID=UPI003F3B36A3